MQTDERRLRFALHFIDMDFDALRPGDWLNLRGTCRRSFGCPARRPAGWGRGPEALHGGPAARRPDPAHMTQEDIRGLQQTVRPWLRPRPVEGGYVTTFVLPQAEIAITGTTVHVGGKAEELFLDHVRCLLDKLPPSGWGSVKTVASPFMRGRRNAIVRGTAGIGRATELPGTRGGDQRYPIGHHRAPDDVGRGGERGPRVYTWGGCGVSLDYPCMCIRHTSYVETPSKGTICRSRCAGKLSDCGGQLLAWIVLPS